MRHKYFDLIVAWAGGAEIQYQTRYSDGWNDALTPSWNGDFNFRIKPQPHPYQDLIDAYKQGKQIQFKSHEVPYLWRDINHEPIWAENYQYRIKPEDIITKCHLFMPINNMGETTVHIHQANDYNVELTWDYDTHQLKGVKLI